MRFVVNTNDATWLTSIQGAPNWMQILWPAEQGYSTGGQLLLFGGMTDIDFGFADIESRVEGSAVFGIKGQPYVVPGTHP